ncbi:hypothetical protein [Agrobacterium tumefaciens]|uniref:hypothetical protein n=1 Tax=Agrobacterium tumefaciens TaxID=358 RepID=UPI001571DFE4|nr:hypothetical protein [Agrobacterium tumefaciens]
MKTEFDYRHDDLTRMTADLADYKSAGNVRYAEIIEPYISVLKGQLAHFNPQADEAEQFVDAHGYTAAMNAYAEIGDLEIRKWQEGEIIATYHRGHIISTNLFAEIADDLAAGGPDETLDVEGYTLRHDGEFLVMTNPHGEARSFPIPVYA